MANDTDKVSQQLDSQLLELENRFNQFMKELEEDFHFVPSAIANHNDNQQKIDGRLTDIEKRYIAVDRKYKILLFITGAITVAIFSYLIYLLLS